MKANNCPFCGSEVKPFAAQVRNRQTWYKIKCTNPACWLSTDIPIDSNNSEMAIRHWNALFIKELTCINCAPEVACEFRNDPYNTNGDCLALK